MNPLPLLIPVHHVFFLIFILSCQALSTSRQSIASNQHYCVVCSISSCDISRKPKSESSSHEWYPSHVSSVYFLIYYYYHFQALICPIPYIPDGNSSFIVILTISNILKYPLYPYCFEEKSEGAVSIEPYRVTQNFPLRLWHVGKWWTCVLRSLFLALSPTCIYIMYTRCKTL